MFSVSAHVLTHVILSWSLRGWFLAYFAPWGPCDFSAFHIPFFVFIFNILGSHVLSHALFFYASTALTFYHSYREVSISWITIYKVLVWTYLRYLIILIKEKNTWVLILVIGDKWELDLSMSLNLVTNNKEIHMNNYLNCHNMVYKNLLTEENFVQQTMN